MLELHLSQGNYSYLKEVKDAHLIANHCKRTLREMEEPLIPFDSYQKFEELNDVPKYQKLDFIKQ